jgi:phosphatidate phosphatase PAH1
MIYIFDIDGTICSDTKGKYSTAEPYPHRIKYINQLYYDGHIIKYFTARGMGRFNDRDMAASVFHDMTENQLEKWGAKYHDLIFGKPSADII